ncbi:hypothetical protein CLOP_g1203 [Closterium sp. NIES-67]|nr:hypothetical protein CLOP_g1203 [Closterium sp. NIES-67]
MATATSLLSVPPSASSLLARKRLSKNHSLPVALRLPGHGAAAGRVNTVRTVLLGVVVASSWARPGSAQASGGGGEEAPMAVAKSEEEWRAILSPEQFRILRMKGTEYPGTGQYNKHYEEGVYGCAGCGTPLYKSTTKFNSGCGWPAFFDGLPGAIKRNIDADGRRVEIVCAACGGTWATCSKGRGSPRPRMRGTA